MTYLRGISSAKGNHVRYRSGLLAVLRTELSVASLRTERSDPRILLDVRSVRAVDRYGRGRARGRIATRALVTHVMPLAALS